MRYVAGDYLISNQVSLSQRSNTLNGKRFESKPSSKAQHQQQQQQNGTLEKPTMADKNFNNASLNSNLNAIDVNFEIDIVELIVKQNGYINDEVLRLSRFVTTHFRIVGIQKAWIEFFCNFIGK